MCCLGRAQPQRWSKGRGDGVCTAPAGNRISARSPSVGTLGKALPERVAEHPPHRCWGMGCSLPGKRNHKTAYECLLPASHPLKPQPSPAQSGSAAQRAGPADPHPKPDPGTEWRGRVRRLSPQHGLDLACEPPASCPAAPCSPAQLAVQASLCLIQNPAILNHSPLKYTGLDTKLD